MKSYHFIILFIILYSIISLSIDMKQEELTAVLEQESQIDDAYMTAVDAGAKRLTEDADQAVHKEASADQFFDTLSSALGILDDAYQREILGLYIPVMAVISENGFYVLRNTLQPEGFIKQWTELIPYTYEDENFLYRFTLTDKVYVLDKNRIFNQENSLYLMTEKEAADLFERERINSIFHDEEYPFLIRTCIISAIEKQLDYYVNQNNLVAERYGITYQFALPDIDESEWMRSINGTGLIVVFQGYPYNNGRDFYNQFVVAGAEIKRVETFYLVPEEYYYICHRKGCHLLNEVNDIKTVYSRQECAEEGGYPCDLCM